MIMHLLVIGSVDALRQMSSCRCFFFYSYSNMARLSSSTSLLVYSVQIHNRVTGTTTSTPSTLLPGSGDWSQHKPQNDNSNQVNVGQGSAQITAAWRVQKVFSCLGGLFPVAPDRTAGYFGGRCVHLFSAVLWHAKGHFLCFQLSQQAVCLSCVKSNLSFVFGRSFQLSGATSFLCLQPHFFNAFGHSN